MVPDCGRSPPVQPFKVAVRRVTAAVRLIKVTVRQVQVPVRQIQIALCRSKAEVYVGQARGNCFSGSFTLSRAVLQATKQAMGEGFYSMWATTV
jgi:hypothetical protein